MTATMEIIVNDGQTRGVYPGTAPVKVTGTIPDYRGGVTMTIRFPPKTEVTPVAQITVNPDRYGGVPCVGEGRWPISRVLELLASGLTIDQVLQAHSDLTLSDVQLALNAAAWIMRDPTLNWAEIDLQSMIDFQQEQQTWQGLSDDALNSMDGSLRN